MAHCIANDIDCAQVCRLAAAVIARASVHASGFCSLCAQVCSACAEECGKHRMEHCQRCAQMCRNCAAGCQKMAPAA